MLTWFVLHVMTHGHTQNQMSGNAHLDAGGAIFFSTSTVGQKKKKMFASTPSAIVISNDGREFYSKT